MPSIRDSIQQNRNRIAAGGNTGTGVGLAPISAAPTPPLDIPNGLPQRGMFPANTVLASDRSDSSRAFRGTGVRSSTFPFPPPIIPVSTKTIIKAAASSGKSSSLRLQVNNIDNPDQTLLNLLSGENITLVQQSDGGVVITGSGGDGLVHGDSTDWWNDAGFSFWRDDFNVGTILASTSTGLSTIGELRWDGNLASGASSNRINGGFSNPGVLNIASGTTTTTASSLVWPWSNNDGSLSGLPLFDYSGWKMVWVFGFPAIYQPSVTSPFPIAKKQLYVGLSSGDFPNCFNPGNGTSSRPPYFLGVRFDTDPGITYTLTSVASASGSTTVYTGTFTGGGTDAFIGINFTIAGFTNGSNNGTFKCVASTTTTITVLNSAGIAETHAATATTPAISDSTFKFEAINNFNFKATSRINNAGTVVDTGIVPVLNGFYRLEMLCTTAGSIELTLSGGSSGSGASFSATLVPTQAEIICGGRFTFSRGNGMAQINQAAFPSTPYTGVGNTNVTYVSGSKVIIANSPSAFYNGTWPVIMHATTQAGFILAGGSDTTFSTTETITFFPGVAPYFSFGNDTQASPTTFTVGIDFFSLVINGGIASEALVNNNARYF